MEFTECTVPDGKKQDLKSRRTASFVLFFLSSPLHHPDLQCHSWIPPGDTERLLWVGAVGKRFRSGTSSSKRSYRSVVVATGQKVSGTALEEDTAGCEAWAGCLQIIGRKG